MCDAGICSGTQWYMIRSGTWCAVLRRTSKEAGNPVWPKKRHNERYLNMWQRDERFDKFHLAAHMFLSVRQTSLHSNAHMLSHFEGLFDSISREMFWAPLIHTHSHPFHTHSHLPTYTFTSSFFSSFLSLFLSFSFSLLHSTTTTTTTIPRKAGNSSRSQPLQKSTYRFMGVNISQSETALCSAVLAQSGTDAMVPLVPWSVPGHQRLDALQSPLGASQHAEK